MSLSVEYQKVANGLRWLMIHVNTPWQEKGVIETNSRIFTNASTMVEDVIKAHRQLLAVDNRIDSF